MRSGRREPAGESPADEVSADRSPRAAGRAPARSRAGCRPRRRGRPPDPPAAFGPPGGPTAARTRWGRVRWSGERVGIREGMEIRVGLATLARAAMSGPGRSPASVRWTPRSPAGSSPPSSRGASGCSRVVDGDGYLLLAGPLRRRPRNGTHPGPTHPVRSTGCRAAGSGPRWGGRDPPHRRRAAPLATARPGVVGGWAGVLAEVADRWADRHQLREGWPPDPRARFARGALRRHVQSGTAPASGRAAALGAALGSGPHPRPRPRRDTVEENIGPACKRHHPDKDRLRHEAQCCIPYQVGRDLEEDPWV